MVRSERGRGQGLARDRHDGNACDGDNALWSVVVGFVVGGIVGLGAAFVVIGRRSDDEPLRAYAYMLGLGIVVPSLLNVAGCVGWIPILSLGIPFVAYGGSLVVATLVGMSILCSALA